MAISAPSRPDGLRAQLLATLLPGFVGTQLPEWVRSLLEAGLGGVCLFGENIVDRRQLRELTAAITAANPLAIIAIDEEGGDVTRLYYDRGAPYPGNALLGRIDDLALTEYTGRSVGWQLRDAGCNVTFGPDADINSNSDNPVIGVRSFGVDPERVSAHTAAWVRGLQSTGVAVSAKHFPGHGDTAQDSHRALPIVDRTLAELRERELVPFAGAIAAGAKTVMTSHILLPQLDAAEPATLSRTILQGLLRDELGFDGVIVSDALDMTGASGVHGIPEAAVRAVQAGVDLLCIGTRNTAEQLDRIVAAMTAAVAEGRLDAARVADAASRVRSLAAELAEHAPAAPADLVVEPAYDTDVLIGGFHRSSAADEWVERAAGSFTVVCIETESNIAIADAPWGPFASGTVADRVFVEPISADSTLDGDGMFAIIGKDLHRRPSVRRFIDAARAEHGDDVLVIDMGWPDDERHYADVATFGASRLVGQALMHYLRGTR